MAIFDEKPSAEERQVPNEAPDALKDLASSAAAQGQGLTGYENLSAWQTVKAFKINALICFFTALSAAAEGYQIQLVGVIVANAGFVKQFGTQVNDAGDVVLASSIMSAWGSLGSVGQLVGQMSISFLSNRYGRKVAMFTFWILLALSVTIECISRNWKVWLVAKILGGLGVGGMQATIPLYISEVAPIRARGAFLMSYSLWWVIGQFFAPLALQIISQNDSSNWLTPVYSQWGHIGLMLIIYLLIPESPAWCVARGQVDRAKKMLRLIYRDAKDFDIEHQYNLIVLNLEHERAVAAEQRREHWYAIFKGTDGLRTVISFWTLMTQQFIGLQVFLSYGTYFFQQAGVPDPFKVTCITSGINIAACVLVIYLADVTGRRWIACYGTSLCWFCNIAVGILGVVPKGKASNNLIVVFACLWNIGLMANGSTGYGFIAEISSQRLRTYTSGFAMGMIGPVGIVMGVLVPYMINANQWNWGLKTCWFFAGVGFPFTLAMWFLIPETAGRSAAELDELFERKIKPYRFHKTATVTQRIVEMNKVQVEHDN
ncbi:uncharacterized protein NECHADRAFT_56685 [Fusarium vanettenii 77-13-4]|uniref:Major facilitator superfamily (MFS) profile domain-containing protein n=1 Tax=Fusarium vanettenii (strain ATCC MYA-4622 / CBS 123669 / FGSC 9596 / NRRL 45880 / 77-13-4) TaxID=660122 RepID=C7ZRE5_FUSV7|nr:uncharacterized protein NECHADRAFT_56685 [Fusarium vanettenii 77-13-4]EEU33411.1 hypothetical protein NECHADRAFT_56685 [Fusarium vanettenii 77-13-4]